MALIKLEGKNRTEIVINTDDISSAYIDSGYGYTDYVLVMKAGTTFGISQESYYKLKRLADQ